MKFSKIVNSKKCAPKLIFFNEKKIEKDSDNFWCRKLTLKVRNWQFSITWFRAGVDLPENLFYEKVLLFTQLSYHLMWRLLKKSYMLSNIHIMMLQKQLAILFEFYSNNLYINFPWIILVAKGEAGAGIRK